MESTPESLLQALRLAAIVESSDDAIVSKDVNGIITSWNAAAERMFGWPAAEVIGRSIRLIIPPERQSEEDVVLSRIRRGERVEHFETVRCRRDGERFDVSITVSPIRRPDGMIIGASKIARDITERKRTERALLEARSEQADLRRRLTTIIDASGALLTSPRIDDVLPAILVVARQVLTSDGTAIWHRQQDEWRIAASHGLSAAFASSVLRAAGEAELGTLVAIESLADLPFAQRKPAYEAEGIRSLLIVPLQTGPRLQASIAFYYRLPQQFGVVERESAAGLGRLASAVMATAHLYELQRRRRIESEFVAEVGAIFSASREYRTALQDVAARAVPRVCDWCAIHLYDEDGELERVAIEGQGDRAEFEQVLRAHADDGEEAFSIERVARTGEWVVLARVGAESCASCAPSRAAVLDRLSDVALVCVPLVARTRTLGTLTLAWRTEGRLDTGPDVGFAQDLSLRMALSIDNALAYEEARDANRLKDEFLANLSHELRTPLNAIVGYAQMLKKNAMPEDRKTRAYDVLDKNAQALTQIVEDVLDISRIVTGKIRLTLRPVELDPIVQHSVETVQPGADAKGVAIVVSQTSDGRRVAGDPDRLQQVFWNILTNAVKFTPRDGRIEVSVSCQDDTCEVVVRDNGAGIDRRFLPHIFERFRQGDSRYGREHGGLGLGLAIAKQIVELHGGTIAADSAGPGFGSTFRVLLPALSE